MKRLALTLWMAASALVCACGGGSTTGKEITLKTQVVADAEASGEFVTPTGWSVRLSRAALSLGALYYFDGEPAFVRRDVRPTWERIVTAPWLSIARAHPGHYVSGMALGQMTTPAFVDLLAGASQLPAADGVTGTYRSARVVLAAPSSEPGRSVLGTKVARVVGTARKGEQTVYFALSADFADVARSVPQGQVDGCAFEEADVESTGVVTVRVKPQTWLNLVDFTGVAAGTAEAPTEIAAGETAQIAFALGVVQLSAYQLSYAQETGR